MNYLFFFTYTFLKERLGKKSDDAKWSAFLFTSLCFSFALILIICLLGIFFNNKLSSFFKDRGINAWFTIFIISPLILSTKFYTNKNILIRIGEKYSHLNSSKRKWLKRSILTGIILLPIALFIAFRLYVIGNLIWQ